MIVWSMTRARCGRLLPRLYVVRAAAAPIAAVFCRISNQRWRVLRWDLRDDQISAGASFRGKLYPRRCTLSPDGALLAYHALTGQVPSPWHTFFAISKLPWLTALAAWTTIGTWTAARHIRNDGIGPELDRTDLFQVEGGILSSLRCGEAVPHFGDTGGFGWSSVAPPAEQSRRDERRELAITIAQQVAAGLPKRTVVEPGDGARWLHKGNGNGTSIYLVHRGYQSGFATGDDQRWTESQVVDFALTDSTGATPLHNVAWIDWFDDRHVLAATHDARLQKCAVQARTLTPVWQHDLSTAVYDESIRSPPEARQW
jgi:hypothetical protein